MIKNLYSDSYFKKRFLNDITRIKSFQKEKYFIKKFTTINKKVCDVGCSTGEFLRSIEWRGPKYGVEITKKAILNGLFLNFIFCSYFFHCN